MKIALLVVILFIVGVLLFPCTNCPGPAARKTEAKNIIFTIFSAYKGYKSEYAMYPSGNFPQIIKQLAGANPRKIVFVESEYLNLNSEGIPVDYWKTPIRFIPESKNHSLQIISAGPDAKFGTQDDITL